MDKKIVIIGGGQAASSFAARFRQHDQSSRITIVGGERQYPYQRPPLSKKYVTGEMEADRLLLRPANWYHDNNVECLMGETATTIDRTKKQVQLASGSSVSWDNLVLTTGSRARALPASIGGELKGVCVLRGLEDADALVSELVPGRRALIIGGGYIGLEAAAVCASRGLKVTLIEAAERILQRVACPETSNWFRDLHQHHDVTIHEGSALDHLEDENGRVSAALLADGTRIETDFVLAGIGIIPNTELAADAGLEVDSGILVNGFCQTSDPSVYAAGDCAAFDYHAQRTRLESVQNAIDQAECAADNLAGIPRAYHPYPWFWSDQYDVKLQIAGLNRGYDQIIVRPGDREGAISHFYFAGDRFLAVDAMNDPRTYMVGKKMLEAGKNITPEQAADTELELKSLL